MTEIDNSEEKIDIFSRSVRAGKRTYYFDVKSTKKGDYYLTLTERKRKYNEDGTFRVEKHKLFLYKEDFDKFADALDETIEFVENLEDGIIPENTGRTRSDFDEDDIEFDDLEG